MRGGRYHAYVAWWLCVLFCCCLSSKVSEMLSANILIMMYNIYILMLLGVFVVVLGVKKVFYLHKLLCVYMSKYILFHLAR